MPWPYTASSKLEITKDEYDAERQRHYPAIPAHQWPHPSAAAKRDYNHYSKLTIQANASTSSYETRRAEENQRFRDHFDPKTRPEGMKAYYHEYAGEYRQEKEYYRKKTGSLFPQQHEALLGPAANAATDTLAFV